MLKNINKINQEKQTASDTLICRSCIFTFNTLNFIVKEFYKSTNILKFFEKICVEIAGFSKETCDLYINDYDPVIVDSLIDSRFTGEYLCSDKYFCENLHVKYFFADDYAKRLLADKPKYKAYEKTS